MSSLSVAVIGARGFVGSAVAAAFGQSAGVEVTAVTRENHAAARERRYNVVVNCAMPSGRFAAKKDPPRDFAETVQKTAALLYDWKYEKFIQVSSVSARCQLDTVYGRHKAAAEALCATPPALIVRLGPMYGPTLTKGVLIDMLHGRPVFVAGESRYAFAPLEFVARWIASQWQQRGVVELGARDAIALTTIASHLGKTIAFEGAVDHQEMSAPEPDFPAADGVFAFLDEYRRLHALP